ncbi:hypothetical protein ACHQM5_019396 [Ranunculus cassubicifolius]
MTTKTQNISIVETFQAIPKQDNPKLMQLLTKQSSSNTIRSNPAPNNTETIPSNAEELRKGQIFQNHTKRYQSKQSQYQIKRKQKMQKKERRVRDRNIKDFREKENPLITNTIRHNTKPNHSMRYNTEVTDNQNHIELIPGR